jgi:type IV pilus assembly protein PilX
MQKPGFPSVPVRQRGVALVVVLLVILVVTVVGIGSAQLALMGEKSARNDRDSQIAFEAAEAALVDAQNDIRNIGTVGCAKLRGNTVFKEPDLGLIPSGTCLTGELDRGLCAPPFSDDHKPTWVWADFTKQGSDAPSARFGEFTCQTFDSGDGLKPARPPRYIIEMMQDKAPGESSSSPLVLYRITAIGFGPRVETRAVVQMEFRKETE